MKKTAVFILSAIMTLVLLTGCTNSQEAVAPPPALTGEDFILSLVDCDDAYISRGFGGYKGHMGVDIASPEGTPIYAADDGVVETAVEMNMGFGTHCVIGHESYETLYAHCQYLTVEKGDVVRKGDVIGYVGNTGNSTGPHLHFEVIADDVNHDPVKWYK